MKLIKGEQNQRTWARYQISIIDDDLTSTAWTHLFCQKVKVKPQVFFSGKVIQIFNLPDMPA